MLLLTLACGGGSGSSSSSTIVKATRGPLEIRHLISGELEATVGINITVPRTSVGSLQISWMAEDGTEVQAGDRILEFDNAAFADSLDETRINRHQARQALAGEIALKDEALIEARMAVEKSRIQLESAKLAAVIPKSILSEMDYKRRQMVLARATTTHDKDLENLDLAERTAATEVHVKEIELAQVARKLEIAQRAMNDLVITAPENGIVVVSDHPWEGRKLQVGDSPWPGLTVLRLPDLEHMQVVADLYDVDDGALSVGDNVTCTLDTYPDLTFSGTVVDITPVAQEMARLSLRRAFQAVIELERTDPGRMRPGMSARVEAIRIIDGDHLIVPRSSIDLDGDTTRVRLASGTWVEVSLGLCSAQFCVVNGGLEEGVALASEVS